MKTAPALKLAVMNDLHVGGPAGGGFQNPYLTTDAASLIGPTVNAINQTQPDLLLIPGDLTHHASDEELALVSAFLDELGCPYVACKGNHDRETPEAAARFDRVFGHRARPGVTAGPELNLPDTIALLVLESSWQSDYRENLPPLATPAPGLVEQTLVDLDAIRPEWLLVVSHYPLVSEADYARDNGGKYAGHIDGGETILRELTARAGQVVCFCGHNHYHHIRTGERWLQCTTAALAEYPAEFRSVVLQDGTINVSTASGAEVLLRSAPEPQAPWVYGRQQDREITWRPG